MMVEPTSPQLQQHFHHRRANSTGTADGVGQTVELRAEQLALWDQLLGHGSGKPTLQTVQQSISRHCLNTLARTVRDLLIRRWNETQDYHTEKDVKRVYYLSLEFLVGRSLDNAILNMDVKGVYRVNERSSGKHSQLQAVVDALRQLGFDLEDLVDEEVDAALGNGGLGRLAACFMDSLASLDYPAWGYGLRYSYGIFQQRIIDGFQVEFPDYWLTYDNPWELARHDVKYEVRFYGAVTRLGEKGKVTVKWEGGEIVQAVAYDFPIPGFDTKNTINIRLWRSLPKKKFDLASFNEGNYQKSVEESMKAENITSVLYPNDNTMAGKELRLKQQDIIRRFKKKNHHWSEFPDKVAIQLNDTHPTLGIAELQRILVDYEGLNWDDAWKIVRATYSFTNHTILPEAMEKWPVPMLQNLLPRHMEIIYDINLFFLQEVEKRYPNDRDRLVRMSIIEEGYPQHVRMAHLAVVGSHTVNGVAEIHSGLIKSIIFKDFVEYFGGETFQNKTNGITPRRWLHQSNIALTDLVSSKLGGNGWLKALEKLKELRAFANDVEFQKHWMEIKYRNKIRLAEHIKAFNQVEVNPNALFDVQVKRIHEYKRQFMNILSVIHRYLLLKEMSSAERSKTVPRVVIFGGKAAPGYYIAKLVIKLINGVADVVNNDETTQNLLKIVFLADYNVSLAEVIIPASDISQHISTAGTEASGTSNMKFVLNGGLILGTHDGANLEIKDEIGDDNIFMFGVRAHEVDNIRHAQKYRKWEMDPALKRIIDVLLEGKFVPAKVLAPLLDTLLVGGDHYLISVDFNDYLAAQARVDAAFKDKSAWARRSILCTAGMGKFSSDRSIREYAQQIWNLKPCRVP